MSRRCSLTLALALLVAAAAPEAGARRRAAGQPPPPTTIGLGRRCQKSSDCKSRAQRCLHENDANGALVAVGFCALPCATFEADTTKVVPGQPALPASSLPKQLKKKPKPRCPPKFECRSKGAGVPIDMCVKE